MRTTPFLLGTLATVFAGFILPACGSSSKSGGGSPTTDAGDAGHVVPHDAAASETGAAEGGDDGGGAEAGIPGYPAFPPAMAQLSNLSKGPIITTPHIVTVSWSSDPSTPQYQAFDDAIGASDYWKGLAEYGVGAATSVAADHVVITAATPNPWDTQDIDSWAYGMIKGAPGNGWPAPDDQTIYLVYAPSNINVTQGGGAACGYEGGYHTQLLTGSSPHGVAYALVLPCGPASGQSVQDNATTTAAHELAEAVTDPYPGYAPAFNGFDTGSLGWALWLTWQNEIADACEMFRDTYYTGTGNLPYALSRYWSNSSANAGHNPCVPTPAGTYNNVTPLGLETVKVIATDLYGNQNPYTTMGWHITPGQTASVSVGLNSDAPNGGWGVQAYEGDCCNSPTSYLTVTPASFTGKNGDTVPLTIKVNSAPTDGTNTILLTFWSATGNKLNHYMPVIIGAY
ncbi:MAG TPA: hypothetical protein VIF09_23725 [Polyangiaceae bacterium]